jgi:uncharacterized protein YndB with AHSA1/START domain
VAELTKEIWIDAPPDKVYGYLVEPELTVRWFGDESWNEPQAGGLYRVSVRGNVVRGEFVELDPGRRVVYTWGWEDAGQVHQPGTTTVEWDLESVDGGTRVRLRHTGLTDGEAESHGQGWDHFVPELARAAAA